MLPSRHTRDLPQVMRFYIFLKSHPDVRRVQGADPQMAA